MRRERTRVRTWNQDHRGFGLEPIVRCNIFDIADRGTIFFNQQCLNVDTVNGTPKGLWSCDWRWVLGSRPTSASPRHPTSTTTTTAKRTAWERHRNVRRAFTGEGKYCQRKEFSQNMRLSFKKCHSSSHHQWKCSQPPNRVLRGSVTSKIHWPRPANNGTV
jgi:hypothetical protein